MFLTATVFVATVNPVHYIIDRAALAHERAAQEHIQIQFSTQQRGHSPLASKLTLARDGAQKYAITVDDPQTKQPPRRWMFGVGQVVLYEPSTGKYMVRNTDPQAAFHTTIQEELPNVDDFAKLLMLPDGMKQWAEATKKSPRWRADSNRPVLRVTGSGLSGLMEIDPQTHRITRFENTVQNVTTRYQVAYSPLPQTDPFRVGENAYQVATLADPAKLPKMDKATTDFVQSTLRNYEPPRNVALQITDDTGTFQIHYTRTGAYQQDDAGTFLYNGKSLTVKTSRGEVYQGEATQNTLLEAASALGTRVEPVLRDLIAGVNPIARILESTDTARLTGNTTLQGERCRVVEAKGDQITLTFYIRESDKFIKRIQTTLPGTDYRSIRDFTKKDASTLPRIEASGSNPRPLTQLVRPRP